MNTDDDTWSGRQWTVLLFQTLASYVILAFVNIPYLAADSVASDGGLASIALIVWFLISPILTNCVVLLLGLPIRIGRARSWWLRHAWVSLIGVGVAALLSILAWFPLGSDTVVHDDFDNVFNTYLPNFGVFLAGWFLLAFSVTHIWLPAGARRIEP